MWQESYTRGIRILSNCGLLVLSRLMTIRAILHHRRMRPQKGPGVAAQAVLRQSWPLDELFRVRRAMRVVAAHAGHLALAVRHV